MTYPTPTNTDLLLDEMLLYKGGSVWGVIENVRVSLDEEWQNIEFPGKRAPRVLLDRKVGESCVIEGTLKTLTQDILDDIFPGATATDTVAETTVAMPAFGAFLASGDYLTNMRAIAKKGAQFLVVEFPYAFVRATAIEGASGPGTGGIPVRIEARQASADATTVSTYNVELLNAIPA